MSSTSALRHVFVGGYTEPEGNAVGVSSLLNERSAKRVRLEQVSTMELASPTWLVRHPSLPVLLATSEASPGRLSSLRWDDDGSLTLLSTVETAGDGACHIAVTDDGAYAIVSSYRSGVLSVVPISATGKPVGGLRLAGVRRQRTGHGPPGGTARPPGRHPRRRDPVL